MIGRVSVLAVALLVACAKPTPSTTTVSAATTAHDTLPPGLVWSRASAEHRAIYLQTYRSAATALEQRVRGMPSESWAVVLDADETVLDNSVYQQELARRGAPYSNESWAEWVKRGTATALPGATEFTTRVHSLGGLVAIVTNRAEDVCSETRSNLRRVGVAADIVLCAPMGQSDKNLRFRAVENGTASPMAKPLRIVMWIGDNIQDFPGLKQDVRFAADSALAEFGRSYFLLPNPMYGSWERNPVP